MNNYPQENMLIIYDSGAHNWYLAGSLEFVHSDETLCVCYMGDTIQFTGIVHHSHRIRVRK